MSAALKSEVIDGTRVLGIGNPAYRNALDTCVTGNPSVPRNHPVPVATMQRNRVTEKTAHG